MAGGKSYWVAPMILFLDFDGVLHPEDRDAVAFCQAHLLWQILRACPHVQVVFSTSWREVQSMNELVEFVTHGGGEDLRPRFIGTTPKVITDPQANFHRSREAECLAWLEMNGHIETPWLAIDDIDHWFSPSSTNLHLTNYKVGLTDADVEAIIAKLNAPK